MSQPPKTLAELLAIDCLHRAVSEFLLQYEDAHPEVDANKLLGGLCEIIADVVIDFDDPIDRLKAINFATKLLTTMFLDIGKGTYKSNSPVVDRNGPVGGVH